MWIPSVFLKARKEPPHIARALVGHTYLWVSACVSFVSFSSDLTLWVPTEFHTAPDNLECIFFPTVACYMDLLNRIRMENCHHAAVDIVCLAPSHFVRLFINTFTQNNVAPPQSTISPNTIKIQFFIHLCINYVMALWKSHFGHCVEHLWKWHQRLATEIYFIALFLSCLCWKAPATLAVLKRTDK